MGQYCSVYYLSFHPAWLFVKLYFELCHSRHLSSLHDKLLLFYFLLHKDYTDAKTFQSEIGGKTGDTGVLTGEGKPVTYEQLIELGCIFLDKNIHLDLNILKKLKTNLILMLV